MSTTANTVTTPEWAEANGHGLASVTARPGSRRRPITCECGQSFTMVASLTAFRRHQSEVRARASADAAQTRP